MTRLRSIDGGNLDDKYKSPLKLLTESEARRVHTAVTDEAKQDPLHEIITELAVASQALQRASKMAMVLLSERIAVEPEE